MGTLEFRHKKRQTLEFGVESGNHKKNWKVQKELVEDKPNLRNGKPEAMIGKEGNKVENKKS